MPELDPNEINEKLKEVFETLNCAAKVNLALGFILRNVDTDKYRYFYAHENNTLKNIIYSAQKGTWSLNKIVVNEHSSNFYNFFWKKMPWRGDCVFPP